MHHIYTTLDYFLIIYFNFSDASVWPTCVHQVQTIHTKAREGSRSLQLDLYKVVSSLWVVGPNQGPLQDQ